MRQKGKSKYGGRRTGQFLINSTTDPYRYHCDEPAALTHKNSSVDIKSLQLQWNSTALNITPTVLV